MLLPPLLARTVSRVRKSLARPLRVLGLPFASLPARIITSVFAAALVASLAVTWIATRTTEGYLREKIDQKFPAILRSAGDRLDLWYAQREMDVETFARSGILIENTAVLASRSSRGDRHSARRELGRYLTYVLDAFSQYETLVLLDLQGNVLLQVGQAFEPPPAFFERAAAVLESGVGDVRRLEGRVVQLASAPVQDLASRRIGSLHALIGIGAIEAVLPREGLGPRGRITLLDAAGQLLLRRANLDSTGSQDVPSPAAGVTNYVRAGGERVIGSSAPFERFGWTLVVEEPYDDAFAPVVAAIRKILAINLGIVVVFGAIAYGIARSITRPIQSLSGAALRIAAGDTDVVVYAEPGGGEIGVLTRAFDVMTTCLRENREEIERQQREIEGANRRLVAQNEDLAHLSITDDLTKLHNHRFFQEHLPREVKRARRSKRPLCLILIDIDDFKKLNDRYGHAAGDAVLRRLGAVMTEQTRETDLLVRYGGEEFALLAGDTDLDGALALAEKIRTAVAEDSISITRERRVVRLGVTVSIGVSRFRGNAKRLFNDADRALYEAKDDGKNCVRAAR